MSPGGGLTNSRFAVNGFYDPILYLDSNAEPREGLS